jgi:hypothetical protein
MLILMMMIRQLNADTEDDADTDGNDELLKINKELIIRQLKPVIMTKIMMILMIMKGTIVMMIM